MKSVKFKEISFQNFLSVGSDPLKIKFTEGINIITGENLDNIGCKNGIGKTTILNFIYWVVFGETITNLKKSQISNNITKGECGGYLVLSVDDIEYTIKRVLDPSSVEIKRGSEVITISTIDKNNDYIKDLIGVNEEVFKNSVVLTNDKTIPFMAQNKITKRKFIEGVMDLSIFGEMLLKIRKDYIETKKESDTTTALFINEQKNLEGYKNRKIIFQKEKEKAIQELEDQISTNKLEIKNLQNRDKDVEKLLTNCKKLIDEKTSELNIKVDFTIPEIEGKIDILIDQKRLLTRDIEQAENSIDFKKVEIKKLQKTTGECPSCKRPYAEDNCGTEDRIKELDLELTQYNTHIQSVRTSIVPIDDEIKIEKKSLGDVVVIKAQLKNDIITLQKEIDRLTGLDNKIKIIETKNEGLLIYISNEKNKGNNYDVLINESEEKIVEYQKDIKELYKRLDILDHAKAVVSEDGVKTIIIKKILTFLNSRLNHYLTILDAPCSVLFDETFDNTITTLTGKEIDYWNLSGGERKRVDSAIIFTFQDLLRQHTGINFNLFVADELFDSAVSEKGLGKILEILRDLVIKNNLCVYLVSHNPNTSKFDIDDTLLLVKKDGITSLRL